jgi:methionine-S-sulfoxide reductase
MMNTETIVLGGGCFWCTEAVFKMLRGVKSVDPGYAGGPELSEGQEGITYEKVSGGKTGYAEVIKIAYDPNEIKFEDLLTVFFGSHDPTTVNRQGADVGTQYRSIILYTIDEQKETASEFIHAINNSSQFGKPVVTEIKPLEKFYPAESYHVDYYKNNPDNQYCEIVINPKLEKVQKKFAELLAK